MLRVAHKGEPLGWRERTRSRPVYISCSAAYNTAREKLRLRGPRGEAERLAGADSQSARLRVHFIR
jgi:hypothetical protein